MKLGNVGTGLPAYDVALRRFRSAGHGGTSGSSTAERDTVRLTPEGLWGWPSPSGGGPGRSPCARGAMGGRPEPVEPVFCLRIRRFSPDIMLRRAPPGNASATTDGSRPTRRCRCRKRGAPRARGRHGCARAEPSPLPLCLRSPQPLPRQTIACGHAMTEPIAAGSNPETVEIPSARDD